jgi:ABC-type Zn2+ transport system substrate-binding protein/surface adhesin
MQTCTSCKESKDDSEFSRRGKKLQTECKTCHSIYLKQHYQDNKQQYLENISKRKKEIQVFIRDQKNKPCYDCKKNYPYYVMDFDHRENKEFNLNGAWKRYSIDKIKQEISKCDLVCANCHRERTWQRRPPVAESTVESSKLSLPCSTQGGGAN